MRLSSFFPLGSTSYVIPRGRLDPVAVLGPCSTRQYTCIGVSSVSSNSRARGRERDEQFQVSHQYCSTVTLHTVFDTQLTDRPELIGSVAALVFLINFITVLGTS